jgi:hypothetical protein
MENNRILILKSCNFMEIINLPLAKSSQFLQDAIQYMQSTDSRAVIVDDSPSAPRYLIQLNSFIRSAKKTAVAFLKDMVGPGLPVIDLSQEPAAMSVSDTPGYLDELAYEAVRDLLDDRGSPYGLVRVLPGASFTTGVVVTRYENFANSILYASKVCQCTGPSHHNAGCPPAQNGFTCPLDGFVYECY